MVPLRNWWHFAVYEWLIVSVWSNLHVYRVLRKGSRNTLSRNFTKSCPIFQIRSPFEIFVAHKMTRNNTSTVSVHVQPRLNYRSCCLKIQNMFGEATAQSRCQTLCSSEVNWKLCWKSRETRAPVPVAGYANGVVEPLVIMLLQIYCDGRILKISQHTAKLWVRVQWIPFMEQDVDEPMWLK